MKREPRAPVKVCPPPPGRAGAGPGQFLQTAVRTSPWTVSVPECQPLASRRLQGPTKSQNTGPGPEGMGNVQEPVSVRCLGSDMAQCTSAGSDRGEAWVKMKVLLQDSHGSPGIHFTPRPLASLSPSSLSITWGLKIATHKIIHRI